jgi:primosomal protein N' (replication factor Y)
LQIVAVACPVPVRTVFDYAVKPEQVAALRPGVRVRVPFGARQLIGMVMAAPRARPPQPDLTYRPVTAVLDSAPVLPPDVIDACRWAADYYFHPLGEVVAAALPPALRARDSVRALPVPWLQLTAAGRAAAAALPARSRRQRELLDALQAGPRPRAEFAGSAAALRRAFDQGWVEAVAAPAAAFAAENPPPLSPAQQQVWDALPRVGDGFAVALLEGVTGSGKTELYLRLAAAALQQGLQTLVLAPEIGLTPQLAERFQRRFGARVACYHSGLSPVERARVWQRTGDGEIDIVVGTRSAVLLPLPRAGAIVVDEEHDVSYKQQEGFRYSARDLAVVRARRLGIPLLLGSATPALESAANAAAGRYRHLQLPARVHGGAPPRIGLVDLRSQPLDDGLSQPLLQALERHLQAGGQALLFQNRRGYAPTLLCHDCGWSAQCEHCDARLVLYRGRRRLLCHHCGASAPAPPQCPECGGARLIPLGQGTERIEEALRRRFPGYRCERFDSERLGRAGAMERLFADVRSGDIRILVGTQVLAKGHDFAGLSFAGIVDADQALYGNDFRALERMGALIVQVAGRVGRAGQPGEVLLQTHQPQHPLLRLLIERGWPAFSDALLAQRRATGLPPYAHLALLRAESQREGEALAFLRETQRLLLAAIAAGGGRVELLGPAPAGMERRAGYFRAQLLLRSASRAALHRGIAAALPQIEALPAARRQRWSIDIDPADLF